MAELSTQYVLQMLGKAPNPIVFEQWQRHPITNTNPLNSKVNNVFDESETEDEQGSQEQTGMALKPPKGFLEQGPLRQFNAHLTHLLALQQGLLHLLTLKLSGIEVATSFSLLSQTSQLLSKRLGSLMLNASQTPALSSRIKSDKQISFNVQKAYRFQSDIMASLERMMQPAPGGRSREPEEEQGFKPPRPTPFGRRFG